MTFGKKLKAFREAKGLKQKDLADLAGISQQSIGHYETEFRTPTWAAVQSISAALGITCVELMDDPKPATKKKGKSS